MVALTFFGQERFDAAKVHPHESPSVMTGPLWILAGLSISGGVLGLPPVIAELFHVHHALEEWLHPVLEPGFALMPHHGLPHLTHATEWVLLVLGSAVALIFAHKGFHAYRRGIARDEQLERERPEVAGFLSRAWGIDKAYDEKVVTPLRLLAFATYVVVDQFVVDGVVNGSATVARKVGTWSRGLADGSLKTYGLWIGVGAVVLCFLWMWS
jgi:NADH-quinone oxidoreductase subunit L